LAIFWDQFPEKIPSQWNLRGEPSQYRDKALGLLALPLTNIITYGIFKVLPLIDPRKQNYPLFSGKRKTIQLMIHAFITAIFFVTSLANLGVEFDVSRMIILGVILLMMGLGNYMNNIKQNYFIGVRTPWTLDNEEVWKATHRFTAKLWVSASFVALIGFATSLFPHWVLFIYLGILVIPPIAYSFLLYQKLSKESEKIAD